MPPFRDPPGDETSLLAAVNEYGSLDICCGVQRPAREGLPAGGRAETIERIRAAPWAACSDAGGTKVRWSCGLAGLTPSDGRVYVGSSFGGPYDELVRDGAEHALEDDVRRDPGCRWHRPGGGVGSRSVADGGRHGLAQCRLRDPGFAAPFGSVLSKAFEFTFGP